MERCAWAAGSVIGREHQRLNKNNQDAFCVRATDDYVIGVIADGCGSCAHSEVGAWLGVELVAGAIAEALPQSLTSKQIEEIGKTVLIQLPHKLNPYDYYLFTILGFIITPEETTLFGCGDGMMVINGELTQWHFANNAPPYLIYPDEKLKILAQLKTADLQSLFIGTDGVEDWLKHHHVQIFWEEEKFFRNPDQVRRTLAIANKQASILRDDTTLISLRHQPI